MDWARDGKMLDSGSAVSGLSSIDDDTDEFGRRILSHARNEMRHETARTTGATAFRKARSVPGLRTALQAVEDMQILQQDHTTSSDPDHGLDGVLDISPPSLNIPKGWGRKARYKNHWVRDIAQDENADPGLDRHSSPDPLPAYGRRYTDWAAVADQPVRSIETDYGALAGDVASRERSQATQITSRSREARFYGASDQEFTADSFVQSTPQDVQRQRISHRSERNDQSRLALGVITERETPQSIKDRLEARMSRIAGRPVGRQQKQTSEETPINMDSHDERGPETLKRETETRDIKREAQSIDMPMPGKTLAQRQRAHRQSSAQAPGVVPDIQLNGDRLLETPRVSAALETRTPKVTGGWIETPQVARVDTSSVNKADMQKVTEIHAAIDLQKSEDPQARAPEAESQVPRSALEGLLRLSRTSPKQDLNVGDDTLASLQACLDPTLNDLSVTINMNELMNELQKLQAPTQTLSKLDLQRRDELLALQAVGERIQTARKGIHDAREDLQSTKKGLERHLHAPGPNNSSTTPCPVCQGGVLKQAARELRAWYIRPREGRDRSLSWYRRLTWLSIAIISFWIWFFAEDYTCFRTCYEPLARMDLSIPIDPDFPRFPYALPTFLYRHTRPYNYPLVWAAVQLWTFLSYPFREEPSPPPKMWLAYDQPLYAARDTTPWPSPSITRSMPLSEHPQYEYTAPPPAPTKSENAQMQLLRRAAESKAAAAARSASRAESSPTGIAKLWSWTRSPAEAVREQAAQAEEEYWAQNDQDPEFEDWYREKVRSDVKIIDTAGLWEEEWEETI